MACLLPRTVGGLRDELAAELSVMRKETLRTAVRIVREAAGELAGGSLWQAAEKAFAAWKAASAS